MNIEPAHPVRKAFYWLLAILGIAFTAIGLIEVAGGDWSGIYVAGFSLMALVVSLRELWFAHRRTKPRPTLISVVVASVVFTAIGGAMLFDGLVDRPEDPLLAVLLVGAGGILLVLGVGAIIGAVRGYKRGVGRSDA